jgi:hypothetical protein
VRDGGVTGVTNRYREKRWLREPLNAEEPGSARENNPKPNEAATSEETRNPEAVAGVE